MPSIARIVVVKLIGEPPPDLGLTPLSTIENSVRTVTGALQPYLQADSATITIDDAAALETVGVAPGLTAIYLVGHAWRGEDGMYTLAMRDSDVTRLLGGAELLDIVARWISADGRVAGLVDTCVAAALRDSIPAALGARSAFIFASGAEEEALEYRIDDATRFALAFRDALSGPRMDVVRLALDIHDRISATTLMPPQEVTYWSPGTPLVLERRAAASTTPRRGWRTYSVVRAVLIVVGALAAMAALFAANYYYEHERIRLELGDLHTIASNVSVELQRLQPATNSRETLSLIVAGKSPVLRITAPATNLLVRVSAHYQDGETRVINFHLRHSSGWRLAPKRVVLRVPSAADVRAHPRMAYVPGGAWLRGDEQKPTVHPRPFWIDLLPVTVETYLPLAHRFHDAGTIEASVLINDLARKEAVENVGLTAVPQLTEQLREIFDVIDASERPAVSANPYVDTAAQLKRVSIACAMCPAPMTIEEARAYCRSRDMRLPTTDEWQLAARGADGRRFPWGDRWDDELGNAGLPQQVGQPKRPEPSVKFIRGASPFGVIDLVGNEGDWIEPGEEDRVAFLGGVYRFNGDDCTVFAETPDIGELLPRYEVTCRCVTP